MWRGFEMQWNDAVAVDSVRSIRSRNAGYTGYLEASFFPAKFQADRFTLEVSYGIAAERASATDFTGWPFLAYAQHRNKN